VQLGKKIYTRGIGFCWNHEGIFEVNWWRQISVAVEYFSGEECGFLEIVDENYIINADLRK